MINIMKCPCEECLLIACCRHKTFYEIYTCDPLTHYLGINTNEKTKDHIKQHIQNFPIFYEILKPSRWTYKKWSKGHLKYKISYEISKRI